MHNKPVIKSNRTPTPLQRLQDENAELRDRLALAEHKAAAQFDANAAACHQAVQDREAANIDREALRQALDREAALSTLMSSSGIDSLAMAPIDWTVQQVILPFATPESEVMCIGCTCLLSFRIWL